MTRSTGIRRSLKGLPWLVLMVVLGHWVVLRGMPLATFPTMEGALAAVDQTILAAFTTRTLPAAAETKPSPEPATAKTAAKKAIPGQNRPTDTAKNESNQAVALADTAQAAPETIANSPVGAALEPTQLSASSPAAAESPQIPSKESTAPPAAIPSAAPPAKQAVTQAPHALVLPGSVRMRYKINGEVKGFPYAANGELLWVHDEASYNARLEISHFLLGSRVQTSKGQITNLGLEPVRFGDKVRSEVAAHFERNKGKVIFSANTPEVALRPLAQDQLSVFLQLASLLGGNVKRHPPGSTLEFQAIGPRSSEQWAFKVGTLESLNLPGGKVQGLKLTREPATEFDTKGEIWLAPSMEYLPVRIRLTQSNGDFVEQQWSTSEKP